MELDLSDNAFGPDGVRGFEALLKSSACFTLHELKLNNCGMGIGGGKVGAAGPPPTPVSSIALPPRPPLPFPPTLPGLLPVELGVCALGHHLGWLVCCFSLQRRKASKAAACGQWRGGGGPEGGVAKQPSPVLVLSWQHRGSFSYMR